jgi:lipoate-protein ligase A
MKYIRLHTKSPYYNLAVEEYLLKETDEDIFMLWQNSPSVIIGKNQNAYAEVDLSYAKEAGINIARRITGGGAVFHDEGNVNYTFITSKSKAKSLDYGYFTRPIVDALASLGLDCALSGRNDLECEGKKISGNAQFCTEDRILHHGTLLFDANVDIMSRVLKVDKEKLEYKAVKSHKSRVANISSLLKENIGVDGFIYTIESFISEKMGAESMSAPQNDRIDALCERNSGDEWILSKKKFLTGYTVNRRKKYPFGIVNINMTLTADVIEDITISGDFFEKAPVEELEALLKGRKVTSVDNIDVSKFIANMTSGEFAELIKG